ncbi:hypothetical protein ORI89_16010 [Sphingobacterium sp. UT-1RO-CII-1]|uniref:hypothetical protein n=1 Tax=Sphingobacterium sp. UT-1RO-CII-1 TaxID=2995225 RepID=UPI00227B6BB8|nr:hypothetical protein [Sphingobacterium sp. UT-1RO-CII-1]MCY4781167.1 hypothetical protein [Sphingobacterium sp. UT-1RO-CII-1]
MRKTEKKLKAKHFRYLSKKNIENPKEFLSYFFKRIDLEHWQEKIYVFLSSGSIQQRYPMHDPSFVHQNLIQQIEYAYVLYRQTELSPEADRFFEYIFEIQSLENWLIQLDDVLRNQTDNYYYLDDDNYHPYLINFIELTHYLVKYLSLYVDNQEEKFQFPYYILPIHKLHTEELDAINYHKRIGAVQESNSETPLHFQFKHNVEIPTWIKLPSYSVKTLQDFFDKNDLHGWREDIRYWYESVLTEEQYWSASISNKYSGANLLYLYSCIKSFIELFMSQLSEDKTLELSVEHNNTASIFPETESLRIQQDWRISTLYYVNSEARKNPLHAILESLSIFTLCEWQKILYDWLSYGLSSSSYIGVYANYTGTIYQTLIKTLEISYLIAFEDEIEFINKTEPEQLETQQE